MTEELIVGPEPRPDIDVPGMHIWGWMTNIELRWLGETAAKMRSIVEVGCLHGRSAFALLTACPGPVYCIDPWNDEHGKCYPSFMGACGHFPNLRAIRGRSPEAAAQVLFGFEDTEPPDMVFLDGAHAYEAVLADIAGWLPHTARLLCGHDYHQGDDAGFPGVAQAVDQVFGDRVVVPEGTSIWTVDLESDRTIAADLPTGQITFTDEYDYASTINLEWPA